MMTSCSHDLSCSAVQALSRPPRMVSIDAEIDWIIDAFAIRDTALY